MTKLSRKQKIIFLKKLSFMLDAGISIPDSISLIFPQLLPSVQQGKSLSTGLKSETNFDHVSLVLIQAGEQTGLLKEHINQLIEQYEQQAAFNQKLIGALIYPICIAISTIALCLFMIQILIPKLKPLFTSLRVTLPLSTRFLLSLSNLLSNYWHIVLIGIFALGFLIWYGLKASDKCRELRDTMCLYIPLFKHIYKNAQLSQIFKNVGTMLNAGITLPESLTYTHDSLRDSNYKKLLTIAHTQTLEGKPLSQVLSSHQVLFSSESLHIMSISEKTGSLPDALLYISKQQQQETEALLKNLTHILEPLLMICMGLAVGFIALSIITPIYTISQNIRH